MKKIFICIALTIVFGCSNDDPDTDIILQDFGDGKRLEVVANVFGITEKIDANADGHPDYLISLEKYNEDGIYYQKDAVYIRITATSSSHQVANPLEPTLLIDLATPVYKVGSILMWRMTRMYEPGDEIAPLDENYMEAFISKSDEYETIQPLGINYIPVVLTGDAGTYYGWIEIELEKFAVTVKRVAICKTANKKIKIGDL